MLPNRGDFGTILGTTIAGPGPNGGILPPAGNVNGIDTIRDSLNSVRLKLYIQAQESVGRNKVYIYSTTAFSSRGYFRLIIKVSIG